MRVMSKHVCFLPSKFYVNRQYYSSGLRLSEDHLGLVNINAAQSCPHSYIPAVLVVESHTNRLKSLQFIKQGY